jgi:hypothetical protein
VHALLALARPADHQLSRTIHVSAYYSRGSHSHYSPILLDRLPDADGYCYCLACLILDHGFAAVRLLQSSPPVQIQYTTATSSTS